jgi:L-2,4-diaminobutyric acid acetyltransferase
MTVDIQFRIPTATDGARVHELIARCPPLERNSLYCNVLQCTHFADTSLVAERDDRMVGFVAGYVRPDRPETMFVWQIAVAPECRGQGLAVSMLQQLAHRQAVRPVRYVEASITRTNRPSWRSFRALARSLGTVAIVEPWLSRREHFSSRHESEYLIRIGPIIRDDDTYMALEAPR